MTPSSPKSITTVQTVVAPTGLQVFPAMEVHKVAPEVLVLMLTKVQRPVEGGGVGDAEGGAVGALEGAAEGEAEGGGDDVTV